MFGVSDRDPGPGRPYVQAHAERCSSFINTYSFVVRGTLHPGSYRAAVPRLTIPVAVVKLNILYYFIQFGRGCYALRPRPNFGIRTDGCSGVTPKQNSYRAQMSLAV
jgi:hypothetical protein